MLDAWHHQTMDDSNTRLREARKKAGFRSARAAAIRHNWVPSTYASHENGQTPVPRQAARSYAKAFKVSLSWLLNTDDATDEKRIKSLAESLSTDDRIGMADDMVLDGRTVLVPEIDVLAGANYTGGFNQEENTIDESGTIVTTDAVRMNWGFPAPYLRDELHIRPDRVHILPVRGDSMNDALFDGDRAIINLDDTDVSQGGIFALLDDQASVIIKQVELIRAPGNGARRIRCTSRNPAYAPFDLIMTDPVKIIGRVASKITRV